MVTTLEPWAWLETKHWTKSHLVRRGATRCGRTPPKWRSESDRHFVKGDKDKCGQCLRLEQAD